MTQYPNSFEFFSGSRHGGGPEICIADDVIRDGKLLPSILKTHSYDYRRCESEGGKNGGGGGKLTEGEHGKLRRATSDPMGPQRNPPRPALKASRVRPRWYWLAFWSVRAPAEMGIDEIKIRQQRRRGPTATAEVADGVCGIESGKGAWRVIRSLSCKGSEVAVDVNVTAPLREVSCSETL